MSFRERRQSPQPVSPGTIRLFNNLSNCLRSQPGSSTEVLAGFAGLPEARRDPRATHGNADLSRWGSGQRPRAGGRCADHWLGVSLALFVATSGSEMAVVSGSSGLTRVGRGLLAAVIGMSVGCSSPTESVSSSRGAATSAPPSQPTIADSAPSVSVLGVGAQPPSAQQAALLDSLDPDASCERVWAASEQGVGGLGIDTGE